MDSIFKMASIFHPTGKHDTQSNFYDSQKPFFVLIMLIISTGCSSTKFTETTKADLTPFADQTLVMLADAEFGFTRDETIQVQKYVDLNSPIWQRLDELAVMADELFNAIIVYSMDIVTLSETAKTDPEKARVLADVLAEFEEQATAESQMSTEEYQTMLADIRAQHKYLHALRAATPLLDEVAR